MEQSDMERMRSLMDQMDIALEGFMASFSRPFFANSEVIWSVRKIAEMRGRQDIVARVDAINGAKP